MRRSQATHLTSREKWYEAEKDAAFESWLLRDGASPEDDERAVISAKWDRRAEIGAWVLLTFATAYLLVHLALAMTR